MSDGGGAQKINREAQQVAVGDGNARKLVPGGLDGSRSGWRVSSAHVVPEHPRGPRASTWVTEHTRGSPSVHVGHRAFMCITAGWTGLTEEAHSGSSSGAWGLDGGYGCASLLPVSVTGQRLAGSGVTETRRAGGEGVLSQAPAWSSPGGRELLRPPAWGWMGCASGSPHHCTLWAQEQLWSLPSTVKWAACECDLLQGPICPQSLTCGGEAGSGHQAMWQPDSTPRVCHLAEGALPAHLSTQVR